VVVGLESGADDYVTKPYDTQELLARVAIGERILKLEESLLTSRQQMTYLATHDVLTGLLNRRAVQERAEAELNRANRESVPLSLILLDVDHFKSVNDRFGHAVGDQALKLVARLLTQQVRTYDWVGRWGGEEFLMVLPGTPLPEAGVAADRIREALEAAALPLAAGGDVKLTVSLGVACVTPVAGRSPSLEEVVRQADTALYRAKGLGRNRVCLAE
jgi:two-component system chemotaxis response regulator CheY